MKQYILALDQGTTSTRAIIFDQRSKQVGAAHRELKQIYPKPGWVEQDPMIIIKDQLDVIYEAIRNAGINVTNISAIGITNQRETVVVWEKNTGRPIYNAISWQDTRTIEYCQELDKDDFEAYVKETTGLVIDPYFTATKLKWILDNVPNARQKAENNELLCGTIDTWLIWNITNGESHMTDFSNASRTMLFNIKELIWDFELLEKFDIPREILPDVTHSGYYFGTAYLNGHNCEITGVLGDQQASLFGNGCFEPGDVKNTYGTGCFMLMNIGEEIQYSKNGLLTTIAWGLNGKIEYALEGSIFYAGAAVQWLRDGLKMIQSSSDTEKHVAKATPNNGVYVVPAFSGLGAPFWDMYARGGIFGLTMETTNDDIVKATLDSMAFQTRDVLGAMSTDSGHSIRKIKVDGGASINNYLMQFQADIMSTEVERSKILETTALGAALVAGITAGIWRKEKIIQEREIDKVFKPKMDSFTKDQLYLGWHNAVKRCMNWLKT